MFDDTLVCVLMKLYILYIYILLFKDRFHTWFGFVGTLDSGVFFLILFCVQTSVPTSEEAKAIFLQV